MKKLLILFAAALFASASLKAQGEIQTISLGNDDLDLYLFGMSSDGNYVTGYVGTRFFSYIWTKDEGLDRFDDGKGGSGGIAISNNGWVAGQFLDSNYMWTNENGDLVPLLSAGYYNGEKWISLGLKPGITPYDNGSFAEAISANGTFVGGSWSIIDEKDISAPVIWNTTNDPIAGEQLEFQELGQGARIYAISDDGQVAGGWAAPYSVRNPVIWVNGEIRNITLDGLILEGEVFGISGNGKYAALSIAQKAAVYDIENDKLTIIGAKENALEAKAVAVSNDGIVVGENQMGIMINREVFVYTEQLGMISLPDYLSQLGITVPAGLNMYSVTGISSNGLKIAGYGLSSENYNVGWYLELDEHLSGLNPAKNLTAVENGYGNINLSWEAAGADADNTFTGYNIYRNGAKINDSPVTAISYNDNSLSNGAYTYTVKAVWNTNEESLPTNDVKINTAKLTTPFLEEFAGGSFDEQYWNKSTSSQNWRTDEYQGIKAPSAFYSIPIGTSYNESIISAYIDAEADTSLYLSYNVAIPYDYEGTAKDSLNIDIYDGTVWHTVATHVPFTNDGGRFYYQKHNITDVAAGKTIRVRVRAYGNNVGAFLQWLIDNINVYSSADSLTIEKPLNVHAYRDDNGMVRINWSDPNEVVNLSYLEDELKADGIGNEGSSFTVANMYKAEDLRNFDGFYLTSITAYTNCEEGVTTPATYRLAVFAGSERIVSQDITNYTPNAWNTFELSTPVRISAERPLYYGLEVVTHQKEDWPIGVCYGRIASDESGENQINIDNGRANLYSEDNGANWGDLTEFDMNLISLAIKATLKKEVDSEPKGRIFGYKVFRDNENLIELQSGGEGDVVALNNYFDAIPPSDDACYRVSVFYTTQQESPMSDEASCIGVLSIPGINENGENAIVIYPNPTNGGINISGEFKNVQVFDINGALLMDIPAQNYINLSTLPTGIYLLKFISTDGNSTIKRVVRY